MLAENFHQKTSLGYLALVRIAVGYHFLNAAWGKVTGGMTPESLTKSLLAGAPSDPLDWHRSFITGWVVPNAGWFSYLVAYGELAIGISLLLGCLVRVSSSFAAFHNLNIFLAAATSGAQVGLNRIFILLHLVFVATSAGRALGIDGWLHRKFPRNPLF
jgi:thiosulfate dehydrogenase [quinone] large subunit